MSWDCKRFLAVFLEMIRKRLSMNSFDGFGCSLYSKNTESTLLSLVGKLEAPSRKNSN
jgi:hypothetical protein